MTGREYEVRVRLWNAARKAALANETGEGREFATEAACRAHYAQLRGDLDFTYLESIEARSAGIVR